MADTDSALTRFLENPGILATDPYPHYARLRREAPAAWHDGPGYWVLSRHADVLRASRDPQTFCSRHGVLISEIGTKYESPPTMMHTDPPEHTRHRARIQPEFAAGAVAAMEPTVRTRARTLVDRIPAGTAVDIIDAVAAEYPLRVISDLLGVPEDDWERFLRWSDAAIPDSEGFTDTERLDAIVEMSTYLEDTAAQRRDHPRDDLISRLATVADASEIPLYLIQLLVAGNETTRNMIAGGVYALAEHPDQWRMLAIEAGLVRGTIEEWLRWTTPVVSFVRTATQDVDVSGTRIAEGDPVLLLYTSANRDEKVFGDSAAEFDITRRPNPHLAFGTGPHVCLGAALARLEGRVVLEELLRRFDGIETAGALERAGSAVIAGYRSVPVVFNR